MPETCFVASGNAGKSREMVELLREYFSRFTDIQIRAAKDAPETALSFLGNAEIKARALQKELVDEKHPPFWVIADDSGLEVDALGGAPGIYSARYAGDHVDSHLHIEKLIRELQGKYDRRARYRCALFLLRDDGAAFSAEGSCEGVIQDHTQGESGFGYDPVFFSSEVRKTFAQATSAEKNKISHRRRAFDLLLKKMDGS